MYINSSAIRCLVFQDCLNVWLVWIGCERGLVDRRQTLEDRDDFGSRKTASLYAGRKTKYPYAGRLQRFQALFAQSAIKVLLRKSNSRRKFSGCLIYTIVLFIVSEILFRTGFFRLPVLLELSMNGSRQTRSIPSCLSSRWWGRRPHFLCRRIRMSACDRSTLDLFVLVPIRTVVVSAVVRNRTNSNEDTDAHRCTYEERPYELVRDLYFFLVFTGVVYFDGELLKKNH